MSAAEEATALEELAATVEELTDANESLEDRVRELETDVRRLYAACNGLRKVLEKGALALGSEL